MGHGDSWQAINPNLDIDEICCKIGQAAKIDDSVFFQEVDDTETIKEKVAVGLSYAETPLRYFMLCATKFIPEADEETTYYVYSAFPWCAEGIVSSLEVCEVGDWCNPIEGRIKASTLGGASINFFDPHYYKNKQKYQVGKHYNFSLAGLVYRLRKAEEKVIELDLNSELKKILDPNLSLEPGDFTSMQISTRGSCFFYPHEKYFDDVSFRAPIEAIECFNFDGIKFYQLKVFLIKEDEEHTLPVYLYASEYVLKDYEPQVGDDIEGEIWLQGNLIDFD
ncbi:hypothetical protein Sta7437_4471 [Stanieria cyanosphaera PCC 7437]|uniref:Uncharacterized protein n=1 Tax=Stanieria cyanosphaera (strain ATCC 29371 / PCC 7437) TaxID=111780 RepID=K9XZB0_STAC7|nr:hypothetical protein [Stanieria cyanosphaera]AFZ37935.1 hypothetical protein Sta7437_4471 [Stanieria cyanosphaera PCC 7437]